MQHALLEGGLSQRRHGINRPRSVGAIKIQACRSQSDDGGRGRDRSHGTYCSLETTSRGAPGPALGAPSSRTASSRLERSAGRCLRGCRIFGTLTSPPVTAAWTETAITWNNQPFGVTINNPATGSRTGSFSAGTPAGCQNLAAGSYVTGATVTSDVASFVSGASTNLGWMIRDDTEGSATTRTATFSAKDLGTVAQEPQLVVTYATVQ